MGADLGLDGEVGDVGVAEDGDAEQVLAGGGISRRDEAGDTEILDGAVGVAVEDDDGVCDGGRGRESEVKGQHRAGGEGRELAGEEAAGILAFGGDDDGGGGNDFAGEQADARGSDGSDGAIEAQGRLWEAGGELGGDGAHAGGGEDGVAGGHHAEGVFEHAGADGEGGIEHDAAEEGAEEAVDHVGGEAVAAEGLEAGGFGAFEDILGAAGEGRSTEAGDEEFVGHAADGIEDMGEGGEGFAPGVHDAVEAAVEADHGAG